MPRGRCARIRVRGEALQQRQREAGGLAGAGLRAGENVAAFQNEGNALRLDGRGDGIALIRDSAEQLGRQAKAFERRSNRILLRSACERVNPSEPVQADANA